MNGNVHGGQQPVSGASVLLYAANASVVGGAATLLASTATTAAGSFTFSGYTCPSPYASTYLVARGGNPGLGGTVNNPALAMMAALGPCGSLASDLSTDISVNELTTVAAVGVLDPYMTSYANVGAASQATLTSAFSTVQEYADYATGQIPGAALPAGYHASQEDIATVADILALCINSTGLDSNCARLFALLQAPLPTDTIGAAIDIFRNPTANTAALYTLATPEGPFQPALNVAPASWALGISANVALPAFSPAGGTCAGAQTVTIADASTGSTIYYTTDGSTPTTGSQIYSAALQVSASETLQAVAALDGAVGPVASAPFTITSGTAPRLAFIAQPGDVAAAATISPAIQIEIADASGNPISGANGAVTLGLGIDPSNGTLLGATTVNAVHGVATFSDLSVDKRGAGYTFVAASAGLASVASNPFNVTGTQACTYYVDSVGGSDTNDGMSISTPWQHIAAIPVVSPGATICLRRGSYFRETLAIGVPGTLVNGVTVEDYGPSNLDMPMLDSSDVIPASAWSLVPGSSPAVYQASVPGPGSAMPNQYGYFPIATAYVNFFECKSAPCTPQGAGGNDLFLVSQENMSAVSANPGSYWIPGQSPSLESEPADPSNLTIYMSPSDGSNPATNGYVYSYSHRFAGIDLSGLNVIVTNIATKKGAENNGGINQEGPTSGGGATFNHVESDQGGKHNMFCTGGCVVNNSRMVDEYHGNGDMFVAYDGTSSGLPVTLNNVTLINGATTAGSSVDGFDAHTGDSTKIAGFVLNGGVIQSLNGARFSGGAVSATTLNVTGLTCVDLVDCVGAYTGTVTVANSQAVVSSGIPALNFFQVADAQASMTIASTAMCGATFQGGAIESKNLDNVALTVTGSLLYLEGSYPNTGVYLSGNNTTLAMYRTTIQSDQIYGTWATLSSTSYSGDNNAFVAPNQSQGVFGGNIDRGLPAWQAATGQDVNTVTTGDASAACILPSFSLTGPTTGSVNQASSSFTLTPNLSFTGTVTVTPMGTAAAGLSPVVLTFDHSSAAQSFTLTPTAAGTISLTTTVQGSASSPAFLPPATFLYTIQ